MSEQPEAVKQGRKLRKRGRPTKLTPEVTEKVATAIRATGMYLETAAVYAGVCKSTLHNWLRTGNAARDRIEALEDEDGTIEVTEHEDLCLEFLAAVEKAIADADAIDLGRVRKSKDWKAAAWRLERRHPGEWGRRKIELTGDEGGPVELRTLDVRVVEQRTLSKEEFLAGVVPSALAEEDASEDA